MLQPTKFSGLGVLDKDIFAYIKKFASSTFHTGIGFIEEVKDDGTVIVLLSYSDSKAVTRVRCEYLVQSSAQIEVSSPPKVDDIVLVISMQHKQESIFTESKVVEVPRKTGYTLLSCVCIPIGVVKNSAMTKVHAEDGIFTIDSETIVFNGGSTDKKAARNGDKVKVIIPAGTFLVSADKGVKNPLPVEVEGTIIEGSSSVLIGD